MKHAFILCLAGVFKNEVLSSLGYVDGGSVVMKEETVILVPDKIVLYTFFSFP